MELTQVRYFITLCRTLNFTRASKACNVTQPAFSRSIQRLEDELGGALLFRERNLTQLTELGRTMRPHLEAMLEAADAATTLARTKLIFPQTSLKIGFCPGVGAADVAGAVREVARLLPSVSIHLNESSPGALVDAMLTGMIDFALISDNCKLPERINTWPLYTDRAVVVLPKDHKLIAQDMVSAHDIMGERILLGEGYGDFFDRLTDVTSCSVRVQRCHGSAPQILDLISADLGIALLSSRLALPAHLVARPFHKPSIERRILLAVVAGRPLNPAATRFEKLCRAQTLTTREDDSLADARRSDSCLAQHANTAHQISGSSQNIWKQRLPDNSKLPLSGISPRPVMQSG